MGDILRKEGRFLDSLTTYLEVCYLDLNGPNNTSPDPVMRRLCPSFDPKVGDLAPGVVGYIVTMLDRLHLSSDDAKSTFHTIGEKLQAALNLPVSPERAWRKLQRELRQ
jgi:hypothetical protein